jgi:hypothetical protein
MKTKQSRYADISISDPQGPLSAWLVHQAFSATVLLTNQQTETKGFVTSAR